MLSNREVLSMSVEEVEANYPDVRAEKSVWQRNMLRLKEKEAKFKKSKSRNPDVYNTFINDQYQPPLTPIISPVASSIGRGISSVSVLVPGSSSSGVGRLSNPSRSSFSGIGRGITPASSSMASSSLASEMSTPPRLSFGRGKPTQYWPQPGQSTPPSHTTSGLSTPTHCLSLTSPSIRPASQITSGLSTPTQRLSLISPSIRSASCSRSSSVSRRLESHRNEVDRQKSIIVSLKKRIRALEKENKSQKASITMLTNRLERSKSRSTSRVSLQRESRVRERLSASKAEVDRLALDNESLLEDKKALQKKVYDVTKRPVIQAHRSTSRTKVLQSRIRELEEGAVLSESGDLVIHTMESQKHGGLQFSEDVTQCCLSLLLDAKVPLKHVCDTIRSVLKYLCHIESSSLRLPSLGYLSSLYGRASILSKSQLGEVLQDSQFLTLHTDGTSKKFRHFSGLQVSNPAGKSFYVSLAEVASSTSVDMKDELDRAFCDVIDVYVSSKLNLPLQSRPSADVPLTPSIRLWNETRGAIFRRIQMLMTDRCVVNVAFRVLLDDLKQTILTSQDISTENSRIIHLFCGMHLIVNAAASAEKALLKWEKVASAGPIGAASLPSFFLGKGQSATGRTIRTVCKAFHHLGSEQSGRAGEFKAYLDGRNRSLHLQDFRGNREYIIFPNGAAISYHTEDMVEYICSLESPNRLLLAVCADLQSPITSAGCIALGFLDFIVVRPLWLLLLQPLDQTNLLQMNQRYQTLLDWCIQCAKDGFRDCTQIQYSPFPDLTPSCIKKDEILWDTLCSSLVDQQTRKFVFEVLQVIVASFVPLIRRQVKDHLKGGLLTKLTPEQTEMVGVAPKDNILSERMFGELDRSIADKPNQAILHRESCLLFPHNKTSEWLDNQTDDVRRGHLDAARRLAPSIEKRWKQATTLISLKRQALINKRIILAANRSTRRADTLRKSVNDLLWCGGVWCSEQLDDFESSRIDHFDKAVKCQLAYHKSSEFRPKPHSLLALSERGRPKPLSVLVDNLREILRQSSAPPQGTDPTLNTFCADDERVGKVGTICTDYLSEGIPKSLPGRGVPRKPVPSCSAPGSAPGGSVTADSLPSLLHKRVEMLFDIEGEEEWCQGDVVRQLPSKSRDPLELQFVVVFREYDGEFTYNLYSDYLTSDLRIIGDIGDDSDSE